MAEKQRRHQPQLSQESGRGTSGFQRQPSGSERATIDNGTASSSKSWKPGPIYEGCFECKDMSHFRRNCKDLGQAATPENTEGGYMKPATRSSDTAVSGCGAGTSRRGHGSCPYKGRVVFSSDGGGTSSVEAMLSPEPGRWNKRRTADHVSRNSPGLKLWSSAGVENAQSW